MPLELHIPACIDIPAHPLHPPPPHTPLRIQIEGPLISIEKLLTTRTPSLNAAYDPMWRTNLKTLRFPQSGGTLLAELTFTYLYGRNPCPEIIGDFVIRDEYLGWLQEVSSSEIDYYGVTFDHLVPTDDADPEVLQINIIEVDDDHGKFARDNLRFAVDANEYTGKKVLAVPRCCQKRRGTQDRGRVNDMVMEREAAAVGSMSVGDIDRDGAYQ